MLSYGGDGSGVKGKVDTQLCCRCHSPTEAQPSLLWPPVSLSLALTQSFDRTVTSQAHGDPKQSSASLPPLQINPAEAMELLVAA